MPLRSRLPLSARPPGSTRPSTLHDRGGPGCSAPPGRRSAAPGRSLGRIPPIAPLLLPALLLLPGCSGSAEADQFGEEERLLTVRVEAAGSVGDFHIARDYQGQVEARRRSGLGFDLPGLVQAVQVDEGDEVARGAAIARLDTRRLEARRAQLDAGVREARTSLDLATSTLDRFEQALAREAVSPQDMDEARRRREGAEASLRRVEAELEGVQVELDKSVLRAPYRGLVTLRSVDEGEAVAPGQAIVEIVEVDRPRVRVGVPLEVAARPDLAEEATLRVGGRSLRARRLAASPEQSSRTRTVDLLYELDEPLGVLRVGQIARLTLQADPPDRAGIALPSTALTEAARGLWSCLVAVPEDGDAEGDVHRLERRSVEIVDVGTAAGQPRVIVRGGLERGELVVMEGLHRLVEGQRVRLEDGAASSASSASSARDAAGTEPAS